MTKIEVLKKMQAARSWKELNLTIAEVCDALAVDHAPAATTATGAKEENHQVEIELKQTIQELNDKIARLTTTNKQLRAENKALKSGGKEAKE